MKVYIDARGQKGSNGDEGGTQSEGGAAARIEQKYIVNNQFCQTLELKYAIRAGGFGGGQSGASTGSTRNNKNFGGNGGSGIIIQYKAKSTLTNSTFWDTLMIVGGGGGGGSTQDGTLSTGGGVNIGTPLRTNNSYNFYKGLNGGGGGGGGNSYGQGAENFSSGWVGSTGTQVSIASQEVNAGGFYGGQPGYNGTAERGDTYSASSLLGGNGGDGAADGYKRGGGGGGGGVSGGGGGGARNSNAGGGGAGSTMVRNTLHSFQKNLASISETTVGNWTSTLTPHFIVKVYKDDVEVYDSEETYATNEAQELTITLNNQPTLQDISKQITSNTDTILKADLQGSDVDNDNLTYVLDGDCQFNDGNTTNLNLTSLSTNPFTIDGNNNITFTIPQDHNVNSLNYYKNNFYCKDIYGGVSDTKVITYYTGKTGYNINGYDFNYYYQRRNTINEITPPLSLFKVNGFDLSRYFFYQINYSLSTDNYSGFLNNPIDKTSIRYTNDVYPTTDINQLLKKLTSTYPKPN